MCGNFLNFFLFGWFGFVTYSSATKLSRGRVPRLTICHTETNRGDHDLCLRRSYCSDIDPTRRERAYGRGGDRIFESCAPPTTELPPHLLPLKYSTKIQVGKVSLDRLMPWASDISGLAITIIDLINIKTVHKRNEIYSRGLGDTIT